MTVFVVFRSYSLVIKEGQQNPARQAIAGENGSRKGRILGKTGQATL
jgi:hypothetical protein